MSHGNFGGAVVPAMAGFLFWKRAKVQDNREETKQNLPALIKPENEGLTSVGKYLATVPIVTSVAKYLKKQELHQPSGVEKYLLRQAIAEKNTSGPTSVSKYLAKAQKESQKQQKTSVDKYLTNLEFSSKKPASLTGVAKYAAEQNLIEKQKAAAALVKRYKEQEAVSALAAKEAAEIAAIEVSKLKYQKMTEMEITAATGVGRYLQALQAKTVNRPKTTGVAKYLAKKIIADSQKPVLSSVAKYLRDQSLAENKKPVLTGVARYLSKQPKSTTSSESRKEIKIISGVAKYLTALEMQENAKPVLSGVAKYLEKQSQNESNNVKLIGQITEESHRTVEGEFIPAQEFPAKETGVSKYLQRQTGNMETVATDKMSALTGVAKYLNKQSQNTSLISVTKPTGVDRYLLARA